jgi:hypothetical protein
VKNDYRKTVDAARIPDENISKRIRESIWGPAYLDRYFKNLPRKNETDALSELVDHGLDINYSDALETAISFKNVAYIKRILETTGCKVGLYHLFLLCQPRAHYTSNSSKFQDFSTSNSSKFQDFSTSDEGQDFLSIFHLLVDHLTHDDTNEKFKGLSFNQYLQNFKYSKALKIWEQKFPTKKPVIS